MPRPHAWLSSAQPQLGQSVRGPAGCGGVLIGRRALTCCQELSNPVSLWAEAFGQLCWPQCVLRLGGQPSLPLPSTLVFGVRIRRVQTCWADALLSVLCPKSCELWQSSLESSLSVCVELIKDAALDADILGDGEGKTRICPQVLPPEARQAERAAAPQKVRSGRRAAVRRF